MDESEPSDEIRRRLEYQRAWREANRDKIARYRATLGPAKQKEYSLRWRSKNRERHNAQSRATDARKKRRLDRNAKARKRRHDNPTLYLEKRREWMRANPERLEQYARTYRERHPDRIKENNRKSTRNYNDTNPDRQRAVRRERASARRKADPNYERKQYAKNREVYAAAARDRARLRRRLKALGLPPVQKHRVFAEQKRANDANAEKFFARRFSVPQAQALRAEADPAQKLADTSSVRRRFKEAFEPTPPRLLAEWARDSALARARLSPTQKRTIFTDYLQKNGDQLRRDVTLDSRARELSGKPPLDVEKVIRQRAAAVLSEQEHQRLSAVARRAMSSFATPPSAVTKSQDAQRPLNLPPAARQKPSHER